MTNKKIVQKVVLAGVVVRDGKVLIVQRRPDEDVLPDIWELPSGKKEPLEKSHDSLLREVKEETGLEVEILTAFSVFDYQIEKPDEIRDSTQINFLVKLVDDSTVQLSDEHQDFAWIKQNQIDNYDISDSTKGVIRAAFELLSKMQ